MSSHGREEENYHSQEAQAETPAQEFNFDQIFTGPDKEQVDRALFFVEGIEAGHKDYAAMYAEDVLNGSTKAAQTEQKLRRIERGLQAFNADPRGNELAARVQRAALHRKLDRMLR